jgi:hypothetical protein
MPEIGRQDGQAPLGVFPVAIPAQQSLNRKSVTKIVQARATAGLDRAQPSLAGQNVERPMHFSFVQPVAVLVHQEISFGSRREAAIPASRIVGQDLPSRGMQRNQAGLSELGPANRENAFAPIDVRDSEMESLTQSQARDRQ